MSSHKCHHAPWVEEAVAHAVVRDLEAVRDGCCCRERCTLGSVLHHLPGAWCVQGDQQRRDVQELAERLITHLRSVDLSSRGHIGRQRVLSAGNKADVLKENSA